MSLKSIWLTIVAFFSKLSGKCNRTKTIGTDFFDTPMKKCLTLVDIVFLGTGHMIGAGIYILTGAATKNTAGPAIVISYMLSGFAAFLAALCYSEFGGRVPKAGSAYSYGYVTIGEFWAFIIGWDMLLENMIGAAALGVAWSGYLDEMTNGKISSHIDALIGHINDPTGILGTRINLIAPALVLLVSLFVGIGARTSTNFNTLFAVINLIVISFTVVYGLTFADPTLWTEPNNCSYIHLDCNDTLCMGGGADPFMPYGFTGVVSGAAEVFFSYVGFESIASAGEETINPQRNIPLGTIIAMIIVTVFYILMALTITMMIPYCQINPDSAFASVFDTKGAYWAKYVVAAGALSGMTTVLFGSLFATPRGVYSMSADGLLFKCLGYIHPRSQVPLIGVIIFGVLSAIMAMIFNLDVLAEFVSIGTLMAYSIVACSVIVLRYRPDGCKFTADSDIVHDPATDINCGTLKKQFQFLQPIIGHFKPAAAVTRVTGLMVFIMFALAAIIHYGHWPSWWTIVLFLIFVVATLLCMLVICAHEQSNLKTRYKVPWVPLVPGLSLLINTIFMLHLEVLTWVRFGIWLLIGCLIYFTYGISHSRENSIDKKIELEEETNGIETNSSTMFEGSGERSNSIQHLVPLSNPALAVDLSKSRVMLTRRLPPLTVSKMNQVADVAKAQERCEAQEL